MKYTILLMRPNGDAADTYMTHIASKDVRTAKELAQKEAAAVDGDIAPYGCYEVLMVIAGRHNDIKEKS